jgi:hypothetical protein
MVLLFNFSDEDFMGMSLHIYGSLFRLAYHCPLTTQSNKETVSLS